MFTPNVKNVKFLLYSSLSIYFQFRRKIHHICMRRIYDVFKPERRDAYSELYFDAKAALNLHFYKFHVVLSPIVNLYKRVKSLLF